MTVLGIDISHWQTTTPNLAGLGFVIVKASEGTTPDPMHATHMAKVKAAHKLLGAYCFARDDVSLDKQAAFFVAKAGSAPTFLAVDNEGAHATSTARTAYLISRIRFHDTLHRQVGLYMSESGFQEAGQDFDWVANWANKPHRPYLLWQYRGSPLDLDRYEGTVAQLKAALAPSLIPSAPPSDTGGKVELAKANRAVKAEGGHGIFSKPVKNAALAIDPGTEPGKVYPLIGNQDGFQCVWLGTRAGFIANADITEFLNMPPAPSPD